MFTTELRAAGRCGSLRRREAIDHTNFDPDRIDAKLEAEHARLVAEREVVLAATRGTDLGAVDRRRAIA